MKEWIKADVVCVLFDITEYGFLVAIEIGKPIKSRDTTPQSIVKRACSWWLIFIIWKRWHSISCKIIDVLFLIDKLFIFVLQAMIDLVSSLSFAWNKIYIREVNQAFLDLAHISLAIDYHVGGGFGVFRWIKTEAKRWWLVLGNIGLAKNLEALRTFQIDLELMIGHHLRSRENIYFLQLVIDSKRIDENG